MSYHRYDPHAQAGEGSGSPAFLPLDPGGHTDNMETHGERLEYRRATVLLRLVHAEQPEPLPSGGARGREEVLPILRPAERL